jgi:hypothetical protein
MEITHPAGDVNSIWYVTNGLLSQELITGQMQVGDTTFDAHSPAIVNVAGDLDDPWAPTYATFTNVLTAPDHGPGYVIDEQILREGNVVSNAAYRAYQVTVALDVDQTHHSVATPFWDFMTSVGTVYQNGGYAQAGLFDNAFFATGLPITEPYWTTVKVAGVRHDVLVQCFERRCLTYTPSNPAGWQVESGNVGQHYYQWRYGQLGEPVTNDPNPPSAWSPPPPPVTPDMNCSDFATQPDAQTFFDAHGGSPTNNVDDLDADHDGIACESLPSGTSVQPTSPSVPSNVTAVCKDGTYSYSKTASGTCSSHGGVNYWVNHP